MKIRDLDILISIALIVLFAVVAIAGLVSLTLGLNDFTYHIQPAYFLIALVVLHVAFKWKALTRYIKGRLTFRTTGGRELTVSAAAKGIGGLLFWLALWVCVFMLGWMSGPGSSAVAGDMPLSDRYHHSTDYSSIASYSFSFDARHLAAPTKKTSPAAGFCKEYPPDLERVKLPRGFSSPEKTFADAVLERRSIRDYSDEGMKLADLSALLLYSYGQVHENGRFRTAPSAGALYPVEIYVGVRKVDGLDSGIYSYHAANHELTRLREGDFADELMRASLNQGFVAEADVVLVLTVIPKRTKKKYGERGYRYLLLDAGHLGENIYLAATALDMGACAIGAFLDSEISGLLNYEGAPEELKVDGKQEYPVLVYPVGMLRKAE